MKPKIGFRERLMLGGIFVALAAVFLQLCVLQLHHGKGKVGIAGVESGVVAWKAEFSNFAHRIIRHL
ncbi:MAG TPA: hypothetical protein VGL56_06965 [Fimbriimonadaceae bacterium]